MPIFRVTIRFGRQRYRYHVEDVEAVDLRAALLVAAARAPAEAAGGDIAEIRLLPDPEAREYTPE